MFLLLVQLGSQLIIFGTKKFKKKKRKKEILINSESLLN